jgi:hypothetical protein
VELEGRLASSLQSLTFDLANSNVHHLPSLAHLSSLQQLSVLHAPSLRALPCLKALSRLTLLHVVGCPDLQQLQLCPSLHKLRMQGCRSLSTIEGLPRMPGWSQQARPATAVLLRGLEVQSCPALDPLPCLRHLRRLEHVAYDCSDGAVVRWQREAHRWCPYQRARQHAKNERLRRLGAWVLMCVAALLLLAGGVHLVRLWW